MTTVSNFPAGASPDGRRDATPDALDNINLGPFPHCRSVNCYLHWVVGCVSVVRPLIPAGLQMDLFEDRCYVGAVPFLMERVTPRLVPPLPVLHAFPELNLRTYVTLGGKPTACGFSARMQARS